jgi:hypothetical protein
MLEALTLIPSTTKQTTTTTAKTQGVCLLVMVVYACNPSYSGGWGSRIAEFEASLG